MMLQVNHVHKSFDGSPVLRDISLEVSKGDVIAILGPSGSGKTTLLRCINFLERPDSGTMVFEGKTYDMPTISRADVNAIRRKTAFVFQNYNLFLNKTVLQNVTLGLISGRRMNRVDAEKAARAALERVGMANRTDAFPLQLSGGQQQRVAIAKELIRDADILIADEIDTGLDCGVAHSLAETLAEITKSQKIITLVISHNVINIPLYDRIIVLAKDNDNIGGVAYNRPPDQILDVFQVEDYYSILTQVNLTEEGGNGQGDYYINLTRMEPHLNRRN